MRISECGMRNGKAKGSLRPVGPTPRRESIVHSVDRGQIKNIKLQITNSTRLQFRVVTGRLLRGGTQHL